MKEIGFIILRHVNNEITNQYWIHCYNCIRNFYPENKILIIDDNSNLKFITKIELYKTTIIHSAYPQRGEILPYYYYLQNKLFDIAVILHDSVFINKKINFHVETYKMIWHMNSHVFDQIGDETKLIKIFNDKDLLDFYENKNLWKGCFGSMCIITYDFLTYINNKYDLSKLLPHILNKFNRCSFERVLACLLQINEQNNSFFGNINHYCRWGITYNEKEHYNHLPLLKVWTGR